MFGKLRKKIFYSIFLVALVFVLSLSAVSYSLIVGSVYNMQKEKAELCAESGVQGGKSYLNAVMGFAENTANKGIIVSAVEEFGNSGAISLLDGLCNNSIVIDGATLYGFNGYVAYSAGIGSPPSLNELKENGEVASFLSGDDDKFISIRREHVPRAYHSAYYDEGKGIISCMVKVYSKEGACIGLLVADVTPETLSSAKLSFSTFNSHSSSYIIKNGEILSVKQNIEEYTVKEKTTILDDAYVAKAGFINGADVAMRFSLSSFKKQILFIFFIILGVDILLIALSALLAYRFAKGVEAPLDRLIERMGESVDASGEV